MDKFILNISNRIDKKYYNTIINNMDNLADKQNKYYFLVGNSLFNYLKLYNHNLNIKIITEKLNLSEDLFYTYIGILENLINYEHRLGVGVGVINDLINNL